MAKFVRKSPMGDERSNTAVKNGRGQYNLVLDSTAHKFH